MNSRKTLYVHLYDDGVILNNSKFSRKCRRELILTVRVIKPKKTFKLQDFYQYYGESIDHLKMLYPEIDWEEHREYLEEKCND